MIRKALILATIAVLGFFLVIRFQMAFTQHFDVDEYAYLHWAVHVANGQVPFRDFYFFMPPGFLWFLVPAFWLVPEGLSQLFAARILEFGTFALLAGACGWLFWELKKSWTAILVPVFLLFLPLPGIKFTEVRPDTLAMALVVLAILFTVRFIRSRSPGSGVLAGLFYGLSLYIIPKTIPAVLVGGYFLIAASLKKKFSDLLWPAVGIGVVAAAFIFWIIYSGGWGMMDTVLYSIFGIPLETSSKLSSLFPIPLYNYIPRNDYFYGVGSDIGRVTNHVLWAVAAIVAAWRLLSAILFSKRMGKAQESIIPLICAGQTLFFVFVFTHHSQYYIPLAVWASWFLADGLHELWRWFREGNMRRIIFTAGYITGLMCLTYVFIFVYSTRWILPTKDTFDTLTNIWKTIPKTEYILDLEGATLYYSDPYYACCTPFGQTQQYLSRPLPNLSESLERTHTKYIYQGTSHRLDTLTLLDQVYITENFEPWEGHEELLVRKYSNSH